MSFLYPLYIAGVLAVGLPIVFHLVRRTPTGRMAFGSLMFLAPSPPRLTRRSRLEHLWLLLLRALALCLLAAAFARPFVRQMLQSDLDTAAGRHVVVLLDTSASMRRGNLWSDAVAAADAVLAASEPADRVAVYTFDRQVRPILSVEDGRTLGVAGRRALVAERLAATAPGWAGTRLDQALITVADSLDSAETDEGRKRSARQREIVVISDLQNGSRVGGLQSYEWPKDVQVRLETITTDEPTNAGLQLVAAVQRSDQDDTQERPRVRISNAANSKRERFRIRWSDADGGHASDQIVEAYVPAGQSRVVRATPVPTGVAAARLTLEGDDSDFDNQAFFVPPRTEAIDVVYFGHETGDDPDTLLYYFRRAFPDTRWRTVWITTHAPDAADIPPVLDEARLAVVAGPLTDALTDALRGYLARGGRVLCVLRDAAPAATLAKLTGCATVEITEASIDDYAMLGEIDFSHPLFAPFAEARFGDFTKIHFWKHRKIDAATLPDARVLARFDDGDPALLQISVEAGTLFVLTAGWHPEDSQLSRSSKFVPLLSGILDYGRGAADRSTAYHIGDAILLGQHLVGAGQPVRVTRPDGTEVTAQETGSREQGAGQQGLRVVRTDVPGIYVARAGTLEQRFAVNLVPAESDTAPLPPEDLERLGVRLAGREPTVAAQTPEARRQMLAVELERKQHLWQWLIAVVLVVLILETWTAGRLTRAAVGREGAPA